MILDKILNQRAFISFGLILLFFGGIFSYMQLGKLEDAEIPIKAAKVMCVYPGASAEEVEMEVTAKLEKAIRKLNDIDHIESRSLPGLSDITINLDWGKVPTADLPQYWDNLRKKIADIQSELPQGAMVPIVYDDFGDVYGIFMTVSGDGYSYDELHEYTKEVKQALSLLEGVKNVEIMGELTETIDISFTKEKFAQLGINPMLIVQLLNDQTKPVDPGSISFGSERMRINVGNKFKNLDEIRNLLIELPNGGRYLLGDVAKVSRGYMEPRTSGIATNGIAALGLGVSGASGVNIIKVGESVDQCLANLRAEMPIGIEFNMVFHQAERVKGAINDFMINLLESILIVIGVLLITMGFRSGFLIASGLVLTILGTFIVMNGIDIQLQRISLAAIIIAMGMLVDNAIVVADGILVDLKRKLPGRNPFSFSAKQTAIPLLGATMVAIIAFLPLALSPGGAGEFLRSLFFVIAISLFISWILAMIQTPFMARFFYRKDNKKNNDQNEIADPFAGIVYQKFKTFLKFALLHKTVFIIVTVASLFLSLWSFRFIDQLFFPEMAYNQFFVEYHLPAGSDIEEVSEDINAIQNEIADWPDIESITTSIGSTPARYTLMRAVNSYNSSYGEIIINTVDYESSKRLSREVAAYIKKEYPEADIRSRTYLPISSEFQVEAKFSGPDPMVLRQLSNEAQKIMHKNPKIGMITDNWKNKSKVLYPNYSQNKAKELNISREDLSRSIAVATNGLPVGQYYDNDEQLLMMLKLEHAIGNDVNQIPLLPVWGQSAGSVPLSQVTDSINIAWENQQRQRYNGELSIKAQCDPKAGINAPEVFSEIHKEIEAIPLPKGYKMEWLGEHEQSIDANKHIMTYFPLAIMLMILIVIGLFNNFRQPIIVFSVVPLALIGVTVGLLITGNPFGFMSVIGVLGLIGMMIKNSIVLLDQINIDLKNGKNRLDSTIDAAVSRFRPVLMASATTVLGMAPLLMDDMFKGMATVIMFGLMIGTIITLVIVPVLYAILYRIDTSKLK